MTWRVIELSALLVLIPIFSGAGDFAAPAAQDSAPVPAYNSSPPSKGSKLPPILGPEQLWGANNQYPFQTRAYQLASRIPAVIHQQPCYCYCDRMGHNSLHSCFEGTHGAQCSTCLKELYYSYEMSQRGKSAAQIRQGIIKGEWKEVNLQSVTTTD